MRPIRLALFPVSLVAALLLIAPFAHAEVISFDEFPAVNGNMNPLSEEYADLGVHFVTTDDGSTWSGITDGDPGGWGLDGTNGSAFIGFNGASYELTVLFDEPVPELRLDVARSLFSGDGDTFVLEGYRDGVLVEEVVVPLAGVGQWTTVSLTEPVDETVWRGVGVSSLHPFGVDNLSWSSEPELPPEPELIEAAIDVWPGRPYKRVSPFSRRPIRVALLGSADLDVADVDESTVTFGPSGAKPESRYSRVHDVNGDGLHDLVMFFWTPHTGIGWGDEEACMAGLTFGATEFAGCDAIRTLPRWFKRWFKYWHHRW